MYVIKKSLSSAVVLTTFLLTTSAFAMESDEKDHAPQHGTSLSPKEIDPLQHIGAKVIFRPDHSSNVGAKTLTGSKECFDLSGCKSPSYGKSYQNLVITPDIQTFFSNTHNRFHILITTLDSVNAPSNQQWAEAFEPIKKNFVTAPVGDEVAICFRYPLIKDIDGIVDSAANLSSKTFYELFFCDTCTQRIPRLTGSVFYPRPIETDITYAMDAMEYFTFICEPK